MTLLASALLAIRFGAVPIPTGDVLASVLGGETGVRRDIIIDIRLPRVLLGALVGGGLALAGATFQALLRNPLAEPYILGISGGASFGAVAVIAAGSAAVAPELLPVAAFLGAAVALGLVFAVAAAARTAIDVRVLLLAGVAVASFFGAMVAFVLAISPSGTVQAAILWMMGSLAGATWPMVGLVAAYTLPCMIALMALSRSMNVMAIGEETAYYLGTRVRGVKRATLVLASLITASGVAFVGVIGFVGLIVPHAVRLVAGSDHRVLLPFSFLSGATFLILADLLSRTVLAPREIPIGVVTALVGVPVFLVLLRRSTRT